MQKHEIHLELKNERPKKINEELNLKHLMRK